LCVSAPDGGRLITRKADMEDKALAAVVWSTQLSQREGTRMTFHRRLRRSTAALVVAATAAVVAVPIAAAADPGRYVQIGGALVAPENVSRYQQQLSESTSSGASVESGAGGSGIDWSDAGIGIAVGLGTALFVAASAYVRRMRLTQA